MIQAANKYIIIRLEYKERTTTGIYIPDQAKQYEGDFCGEVVSIGSLSPFRNELKIGDKILYQRHEGFKILVNNDEYWAIKSRWVHGKKVL